MTKKDQKRKEKKKEGNVHEKKEKGSTKFQHTQPKGMGKTDSICRIVHC